jgi:undecaprenyl-diphosphatase
LPPSDDEPFGPAVARFDAAVDAALDRVRGHAALDRAMYVASQVGDWSVVWHLAGWTRALADHGRAPDALRLSASLAAESLLVNQGVKRLFRRSRPVYEGERPHNLRRPTTSSFPSGHASSAFLAAALLTEQDRTWAPLWYGAAVAVAISRPYVRLHHATDTVGGAVVGVVLGRVAVLAWRALR